MMRNRKSYSEMLTLKTYEERLEYLMTNSFVGKETFGRDRYANQIFYKSQEWKKTRNNIIIRDNGCDLGLWDRPIEKPNVIYIHHINEITLEDIINRSPVLFDPDNLVCVTFNTHNMIHYGLKKDIMTLNIERLPNDTAPWLM